MRGMIPRMINSERPSGSGMNGSRLTPILYWPAVVAKSRVNMDRLIEAGFTDHQVKSWAYRGTVPWGRADLFAVTFGFHPLNLWAEFYDRAPSAAERRRRMANHPV